MSGGEKRQVVADMWHLVRQRLAAELSKKHPDWSNHGVWAGVRNLCLAGSLGEFAFLEADVEGQVLSKFRARNGEGAEI